jgi:hypothetical protein
LVARSRIPPRWPLRPSRLEGFPPRPHHLVPPLEPLRPQRMGQTQPPRARTRVPAQSKHRDSPRRLISETRVGSTSGPNTSSPNGPRNFKLSLAHGFRKLSHDCRAFRGRTIRNSLSDQFRPALTYPPRECNTSHSNPTLALSCVRRTQPSQVQAPIIAPVLNDPVNHAGKTYPLLRFEGINSIRNKGASP